MCEHCLGITNYHTFYHKEPIIKKYFVSCLQQVQIQRSLLYCIPMKDHKVFLKREGLGGGVSQECDAP